MLTGERRRCATNDSPDPVDPPRPGDEGRPGATGQATATQWGLLRPARVAGELGAVGLVATALGALFLRPWLGGWSTPVVYGNDTIGTLTMVLGGGWTGTARGAETLGAPHGAEWIDFPLGPDRLHLVGIRLVRLVWDDPMVVVNVWLLVGFALIACSAFGVMRHFGMGGLLSGSLAIVFAFAPYHFETIAAGHFFLATYFAVPLGVLLAVWASDGSLQRNRRGRVGWTALWVLVVGSASAYYAAFALVGIVAVGAVRALRRGHLRLLVTPLVVAGALALVVVANVAGDLVAAASAGPNHEASQRASIETDSYGLRPAALAVPAAGHRFAPAGALGDRYSEAVPRRGGSYLGLVALVGLAVVAARSVRHSGNQDPPGGRREQGLHERLAVIAVSSIAVGGIGGAGLLVAIAGFGQIRVWSRISIVVAFVGLLGLGVVLQRRTSLRDDPSLRRALLAVGLVAVAVIDQVANGAMPDHTEIMAARGVDEEVASGLVSLLDPGDDVFVHPPMAFPGGVVDRGAPMHSTLAVWSAAGGQLNWSAGAIQGRSGDWRFSWASREPVLMVAGLAAAGFDAVLVDRRVNPPDSLVSVGPGPTGGADASDELERVFGPADGVSGDGSRVWFDLRPLRDRMVEAFGPQRVEQWGRAVTRPVGTTFSGAATLTTTGREGVRLLGPEATLTLRRGNDQLSPVEVRFLLAGEPGAAVEIRWPDGEERVVLAEQPVEVRRMVSLADRDAVIGLRTDAGSLRGAPSAAGDVRLALGDLRVGDPVVEELGAAIEALLAAPGGNSTPGT